MRQGAPAHPFSSPRRHEPWILAIDAVASCCAVALAHGHWFRGRFYSHSPQTLSRRLLPALDTLFAQVEISVRDLGVVAVNNGPGSFTALRITMATLAALWRVKRFEIFAVDTLTLQVSGRMRKGTAWSLIPAGRTEYALARYRVEASGQGVPARISDLHRGSWYQLYPLLADDTDPIYYPEPGVIPMQGSDRLVKVHESERVMTLLDLARRADPRTYLATPTEVDLIYLRPPPIHKADVAPRSP